MLDGYREIRTERSPDGNYVLVVRAIEKGHYRSARKSYSKADDAPAVHVELESEIRGRPYDPGKPEDQ